MNFGAKNNPSKNYDRNAMIEQTNTDILEDKAIRDTILRQTRDAIEWFENRGNIGDNVDIETIESFLFYVKDKDAIGAMEIGHLILETQMHPTAEDICKAPVKQFVYNATGKRAYRYETEE